MSSQTGSTTSSSGGVNDGGNEVDGSTDQCDLFATLCLTCFSSPVDSDCVLSDRDGARSTWATRCRQVLAATTASDRPYVLACLEYAGKQALPASCSAPTPPNSPCYADQTGALRRFFDQLVAAPIAASGVCTNGRYLIVTMRSCGTNADETMTAAEWNQPGVETSGGAVVDCTPVTNGEFSCTCTAGKNTGKVFSSTTDACGVLLWTECNQ